MAALLCAALPSIVAADQITATDDLSLQQRTAIDALFKEYTATDRPGCALGVMRNGQLAYARGYGLADVERRVPITAATLFDIGSTSKQFTAAAVILLELDGKLALSDDVRKYVPELPGYGAPITIDHLLHHTSGLRDYIALLSLAGVDLQQVSSDEQALAVIARQRRLNFHTGSRYDYTNSGYFLLSVIVQRVSGKSLGDFARERIFLPLGIVHSRFRDEHAEIIPNRALGYTADDESPEGESEFKNAVSDWEQTGDGALHLSIEEALKWDGNFYQPRVGGPALIERLQRTGELANGEAIEYARGLMVDKYRGVPRVHHGGAWVGYHAMLERFPEQRTSIAVFCNFEGGEASKLSDQVADIVLADALAAAARPSSKPQNSAAKSLPHQRFLGSYFAAESETIFKVDEEKGALILKIGSTSLPLTAAASTSFAVNGYPATLEFLVEGRKPAHALQFRVEGDDPTTAVRFARATPSNEDLQAYAGAFYSPEVDITWRLVIEEGRLTLHREIQKFVAKSTPLEPAMSDAFSGEAGFMRFTRDAAGRVTGFDLSSSRMQGIRFEPRPPPH